MGYELEHRTNKTVTKGTHYPLGATLTPDGVNFALYSQQRHRRVPAAVRHAGRRAHRRHPAAGTRQVRLARARARASRPGSCTATRSAANTARNGDCGSTTPSCCSIPTRKAVTGKFRNTDNLLLAYDPQPGAGERAPDHPRQHRDRPQRRSSSTTPSTGRARRRPISGSSSSSSTKSTSRDSPRIRRPA